MMRAANVDGERRLGLLPGAADVRRARAVVDRRRPDARDRRAHRVAVQQIDGLPLHAGGRMAAARAVRIRAMPRDDGADVSGAASPTSRSSRWLPAKPAAPVTSVVAAIVTAQRGTPLMRAVERREIAEAGERERQEEAVVGRDDGRVRRSCSVWYSIARPQHCAL